MHIIRSMPQGEDFELGGNARFFPVRGQPQRIAIGETVFFSHRGKIVGRSKLLEIRPVPAIDSMEYLEQGEPTNPNIYYYLVVSSIRAIRNGPSYIGRVGIRYIDRLKSRSLKKRLMESVL